MTATLLGGRYRLEQPIGSGGMATVWRAVDTETGQPVAVKRLHARVQDDPELAERFRREAELVERLSHPNLVRLLDQGADAEGPFLVFELVDGTSLKNLVRQRGRLEPHEAARICAQVAHALQVAHEQGIVHRDIKSQNVLVTRDGDAKLTDFGIARLMAAEEAGLTRTGMMIGTSDYLAPEQARGRGVDGRTDVYSLGIVLYECLTGEMPFTAENPLAVALRHVQEPMPDPRDVVPEIPGHLAAAVLRACGKEPASRFNSAEDFADALEADPETGTAVMPVVDEDRDEDTGQIRVSRRRRWPWIAGGAGVLAVAAAVAVLLVTGVVDLGGGGGGGGGGPTTGPTDTTPRLVELPRQAIEDLDPEGGGSELPSEVPLSYDDNPATAWHTENYATESFGNLKKGVGLLVRLQRPAVAREMDVVSASRGGAFEVQGSLRPDGTRPVYGRGSFNGGQVRVPLKVPAPDAVYVLWITKLPPARDDAGFRAEVAEVSLRGAAK